MWFGIIICAGAFIFLFCGAFEYFDFISGWKKDFRTAPSAGTSAKATFAPPAPEVKFRKFFITHNSAKSVELIADFNGWGAQPAPLTPYKKGYYEITLALAAGDYKYVFLIDGKEVLDPSNKDVIMFAGREVNVKTIR